MEKSWKSHDAGLIDIIGGLIIIAFGVLFPIAIRQIGNQGSPLNHDPVWVSIALGITLLCLGLLAIYGGEMAMKQRRWFLALIASICASLVLIGLPSIILTILSRHEFQN